jgi:hypothetical protein
MFDMFQEHMRPFTKAHRIIKLTSKVRENEIIHKVVKFCLHSGKTRGDLQNRTEKLQPAMEEFIDHSDFSEADLIRLIHRRVTHKNSCVNPATPNAILVSMDEVWSFPKKL